MVTRFIGGVVLALGVVLLTAPALAQRTSSLDLVTMKNGDIHHGTVAEEVFVIETAFGEVSIPYGSAKWLRLGNPNRNEPDIITTTNGSRFSGKIKGEHFFTMRPQEPSLTLFVADVEEIEFGSKRGKKKRPPLLDAVELTNGDSFRAVIQTQDFLVKTGNGLSSIKKDHLFILDAAKREDDETTVARLTFNGHQPTTSGILLNSSFVAELETGQQLKIPGYLLETIAFNAPMLSSTERKGLQFNLRKRVNPTMVIQDRLDDGTLGPELAILRAGLFVRGGDGPNNDTDEKPPVEITLPRPFAISLYEVTFDDYDRYCESAGIAKPSDAEWGRGRRPAINVSWEEAVAYTKWLSEKTGETYRLPSDAEWEYAARGGSPHRFWWGEQVGKDRANCAQCGSLWDAERTARVGKFPPNAYGLHDTAGNVFEWVADCFHDTFAKAPKDGAPLEKAAGCGKRVIRGGAWSFPPKEIRSANRWRDFPSRRSDDTGFRVVRELK